MIPDLGRYATEVLAAYGATLLVLGAVAVASWRRFRRVRAAMERAERDG